MNNNNLNIKSIYEEIYEHLFSLLKSPPSIYHNITLSIISNLLRDFRKLLKSNDNEKLSTDIILNIYYSCENFIIRGIELFLPTLVDHILNNNILLYSRYDTKIYLIRLTIQIIKYYKDKNKELSDTLYQFISKYIRHVIFFFIIKQN